jgi:hypothetical protein
VTDESHDGGLRKRSDQLGDHVRVEQDQRPASGSE